MMTPNMPTGETMNEGSDIPPDATPKPPMASGGMEIPIPIGSLAMPGEDQQMNNPDVGDPVQVQAEGTVTRIEGQTAFVSFKSVNGKPLDPEGAKTTNTPGQDENGDNEFNQLQAESEQRKMY